MRWLGLVVFAALPLQWFVVGQTPLGAMRLHQAVLLLAAAVIAVTRPPRAFAGVVQSAAPFIALNVLLLLAWSALALYQGVVPRTPVQELIYLGVMVVLGAYVARAASGLEPGALGLLRWATAAAVSSLVLALVLSMLSNGVNPLGVIQQAVASADPELLQKELFRSSFVGYGYDAESVRGNIRHEVFGAVLASMYVSVWAERLQPGGPGAGRTIRRVALVVAVGLLVVSMSRAVLIAAALWPVISLLRSALTYTVTRRQLALTGGAVAGAAVLALSGLGQVIWVRFTQDTSSYQARTGRYDDAFAAIRDNFWVGVGETTSSASHNYVIDAWLRGGVLVAAIAAAVLLVLVVSWVRVVLGLPTDPVWMVPVAAAFALPVVRMLTSGTGLIPPVGWVVLAFVVGALTYRREELSAARGANRATAQPAAAGEAGGDRGRLP